MCCRARTPKNFQVHANMMIKKNLLKIFVAMTKSNNPHFSHVLFFVAIGCSNKKMLPNKKKTFLFRKFFSKILFNVSSDPGHRGGVNTDTTYVFASYTKSELHFSKFMSSSVPFLWIFCHFLGFLQIWANFKILYKSEFSIFFDKAEICCIWNIEFWLSQFTYPYLHPAGTKTYF